MMAQNQRSFFHFPNQTYPRPELKALFRYGITTALLFVMLAVGSAAVVAQTTIYVDADASAGANDGSSWQNAYTFLQDALAAASSGDQIWVAEGVYYPDEGANQTDNDPTSSFRLLDNVEVYGGFSGNESSLGGRDWENNTTVLSGDADKNNVLDNGNVTNVVFAGSNVSSSTIDGFTITGGNARGFFPENSGGGLLIEGVVSVTNSIITENSAEGTGVGGGILTYNGQLTLESSIVKNNSADIGGGIGVTLPASAVLINVDISSNNARLVAGILNQGSTTATNTTITGNNAMQISGGVETSGSNAQLTVHNSVIWNNTVNGDPNRATSNVYLNPGSDFTTNTATYTYSLIGNSGGSNSWDTDLGTDGGNNIDADPLFADPANGDYSLTFKSPAINAGSNQAYTNAGGDLANDTDLAGNSRLFEGAPNPDVIDMGAYEFQGEPFSITPNGNNVLFVDKNVSGGDGSGNSWNNAIPELRDALNWAQDWDGNADGTLQIWVADGTYTPVNPADAQNVTDQERQATFQMVNDVKIYGGFAGGEATLDARDWAANLTTLSGDINQSTDLTGNSYSVVTGSGTNNTAVIDGFTITMGNADVASGDANNSNRSGGGMYNSLGSPTVKNNTFTGNTANNGGGIYNYGSLPIITNSIFSGNTAIVDGGGMYNYFSSSPTITNSTFSENTASSLGGGMYNSESNPTLTNSIIWGNTSGGIFNDEVLTPTVTYSIVQDGYTGTGNLNTDPLFVDAAGGDYSLMNTSPAINTGDPATDLSLFPGGPDNPEDLSGNPRVFDGLIQTIDMGAYEFQGNAFGVVVPDDGNIVYVDKNVDTGVAGYNASGNSWDDAIPELRDATAWAQDWDGNANGTLQIWVADGIYTPVEPADDQDVTTVERTATFQLVNDVEIYGGFDGGESSVNARDWNTHVAILSGDIDGNDLLDGFNSLHVVYSANNTSTARLDGFTITGGNANGSPSPAMVGGGMLISNSAPTIANSIFTGNTADTGGGLLITGSSNVSMDNMTFMNNSSDNIGGGFMVQTSSTAILSNGIVVKNTARLGGV